MPGFLPRELQCRTGKHPRVPKPHPFLSRQGCLDSQRDTSVNKVRIFCSPDQGFHLSTQPHHHQSLTAKFIELEEELTVSLCLHPAHRVMLWYRNALELPTCTVGIYNTARPCGADLQAQLLTRPRLKDAEFNESLDCRVNSRLAWAT